MIILKNQEEVARLRRSARIAAKVLDAIVRQISPGITTRELDDLAAARMAELGARSAFLGYRGFPGHTCLSINEEVVHGIPGPRRIEVGDIVSVDVGVSYDGFVGDTAMTVMVGVTDPEVIRLVRTAEQALRAGIAKAQPGGRLSDISHAIESCAAAMGFNVVRDFVGHGIGRRMHEDPKIPNFGLPGEGAKLKPGMTLALEPMINQGTWEVEIGDDGWTVRTRDRKLSAHWEHTVAIREDGPEILTIVD